MLVLSPALVALFYRHLSAESPPKSVAPVTPINELAIPISPNAVVSFASMGSEEDISGEFGDRLMAQIRFSLVESIKDLGNGDIERGLMRLTGESSSKLPARKLNQLNITSYIF